jgi:hypothetical protein
MAQKTPLPALTVMYADRWNSSWFVDLDGIRTQLMEDCHLRLLLTGFLRLKRQWLFLLSINKSGGFNFFQLLALNYLAKNNVKALVEPESKSKRVLLDVVSALKKNKLLNNTDVQTLTQLPVANWKKRIPFKKANIWSKLKEESRVVFSKNLIMPSFNKNNKIINKELSKVHASYPFTSWLKVNKFKLGLNYYYQPLEKFFYKDQNTYNVLTHKLDKVMKKTLKDNPNTIFIKQKEVKENIVKRVQNRIFKGKRFNKNMQKRSFSTMNVNAMHNVIVLNKQNNLLNRVMKLNKLNNYLYNKSYNLSKKNNRGSYQVAHRLSSYIYKRIFLYKKYKNVKVGYRVLLKKYGKTLRYRRMKKRLSTSILFMCKAISRITGMRFFFKYIPLQWQKENYAPLKKFVVFEKFGSQKYFTSTVPVVHLAVSRGSANLLTDLLVRKLRKAYTHAFFLSCVEKICRYFMADYESHVAYKHSLCKGIDILFKGKLNGGTRSKVWRLKFGPVHTSTFFTNTREEHAKCMTRYGVFHIRVRLKIGAIA